MLFKLVVFLLCRNFNFFLQGTLSSSSERNQKNNFAASVKSMSHEDLSRLELQLREQLNSMKINRETERKQRVSEESNDKIEISLPLLPAVATQGDLKKLKVRS